MARVPEPEDAIAAASEHQLRLVRVHRQAVERLHAVLVHRAKKKNRGVNNFRQKWK